MIWSPTGRRSPSVLAGEVETRNAEATHIQRGAAGGLPRSGAASHARWDSPEVFIRQTTQRSLVDEKLP
jgi:hypothetical protein